MLEIFFESEVVCCRACAGFLRWTIFILPKTRWTSYGQF